MQDMFDVYGAGSQIERQVFHAEPLASSYRIWEKPRGAAMIGIWCIGGAGGGAGGGSSNNNSARAGAGGGSPGGISRLMVAAYFLPDRLYVLPGKGGASVAGGVAGNAGFISQVSMYPQIGNAILASHTLLYANGGGGGAVNISGGTAASGAAIASCPMATMGRYLFSAGVTGGSGGANTPTAGAGATALGGSILCAGGGGGGANASSRTDGGQVLGGGPLPTVPKGLADGSGGTQDGQDGSWLWTPMCGTGGSGGGSVFTGTGGRGGDGAFGCGGGGGAQGNASGGRGGAGGNGFVIITAWG